MSNDASGLGVLQRLAEVERRLTRIEEIIRLPAPQPKHEQPISIPAMVQSAARRPAAAKASVGVVSTVRPGKVSVESLIGGRFFAVLGAMGTVIGVALFLKLAYDNGWLGRIPPVWRCLGGAGVGVGLLIAGEAVRKRLGAWASAGISAAGIGALYASGYAAFALFELIGAWAAFAMLAVASSIGIVIGARSRMPALSVLSFVGAYLVPFLLKVDPSNPFTRPAYLLALLAGGMTMASWLRGGFRVVGVQVFIATMLLGSWAVQSLMKPHPEIAIAFVGAVWAVVHAALLFATRQRLDASDDGETPIAIPRGFWRTGVLLASFLVTGWSVGLSVIVLRTATSVTDWLAPLGGVGATALMAIGLCGHLRLFVERPRTEREFLGAALLTQAAGLLIGVVAMAASGSTQLFLWLGLGTGASLAARWADSKALRIYAIVLLGIAMLRVCTLEAVVMKRLPTTDFFGLAMTSWSGHVVLVAAGWFALAATTYFRSIATARCAAVLGVFLLAISVLNPLSDAMSVSVAWALLAVAAIALSIVLPRLALDVAGLVMALIALLPWARTFAPWVGGSWDDPSAALLMHPGLWRAAVIAGVLIWASRQCKKRSLSNASARLGMALVGAVAAGLLAWCATSLEVSRAARLLAHEQETQLAAVSIWWGLLGVGLIVGGFARSWPVARHIGLALLGLAAIKVVFVDLADVPAMWRVVSFLLLGLLMLGVALVYGRLNARAISERSTSVPDGVHGDT